jgi:hypothetical protein
MSYELAARLADFQEDDEVLVLTFADDASEAEHYVMLQYPLNPDEQDVHLRQDGLYIERDDRRNSCYLGIRAIRRVGGRIEIYLTKTGQQHLQTQHIIITPLPWRSSIDQGLARLAELARGEYDVSFQ